MFDVDLVGFEGTPLPRAITDDSRITVHRLSASMLRHGAPSLSYAPVALVDAARISFRLWRTLRRLPRPDLVLVQNPPAFPTLIVTRWALARDGRPVRHRLAQPRVHAAAACGSGSWHPAVRLARWLERRDARQADANLCVSRGLAAFLKSQFGLLERAASCTTGRRRSSRPSSASNASSTARRSSRASASTRASSASSSARRAGRKTRTSTSSSTRCCASRIVFAGWEAADPSRRFPDLVILVTGDGARRTEFERRFAGLPARRVHLRTRWLEPEDYPRVVGSADLGLCLHRSSSGLDIPMKVADLFGAGVPVCALDYGATLAERVRHGDNGLLFSTAEQLADVLFDFFEAFPGDDQTFERLRVGARKSARMSWDEGWTREALPVLLPDQVSSGGR